MTLRELKEKIENKTLDDSMLIFKDSDSPFLISQYINAIATLHNLEIKEVDNLDFDDYFNCYLYIYRVDKFSEKIVKNNTIVICKSSTLPCIEFKKLENWQIEDYAKVLVPGLSNEKIKWLCGATKYDVYRIKNELDKVSIFPQNTQEYIFDKLDEEGAFSDLVNYTVFDFINAIIKKDKSKLQDILECRDYIDLEPAGVLTLLINNVKMMVDIKSNHTEGINPKQVYAIKKNVELYNDTSLVNLYDILTQIDYKLKSGLLDYDKIIDYIIMWWR